ncbi:hypothetical protein CRM22_004744 [Opisthorchis felineus]|uniref:Uncharacterized protein n=1 Tax=Opisthorchis felineus TaxID=147828 RepID=A0A4S2LUN4_OPIFE|nr:hypothetical protein CRM22_004744 [Opisthorchis felineus]
MLLSPSVLFVPVDAVVFGFACIQIMPVSILPSSHPTKHMCGQIPFLRGLVTLMPDYLVLFVLFVLECSFSQLVQKHVPRPFRMRIMVDPAQQHSHWSVLSRTFCMTADSDQPKSSNALDPWKILESHPAFATDIGASSDPALAGLQALKYESEDPDANALSYKDEGNYHYKRKEFSKAIDSYSGGLRAKPKDMNLVAVLLTNRAICHWYLRNYRSCILDCKAALVADPQHQKAYVKAVEACLALDKIRDCLELCELGLTKFPDCQKLTEAHTKARQKQSLSDQAEIAKLKAQREEENKQLTTFKLITDRGIQINFRLPPVCVPDAADARFYVDSSNHLHWSLLFMYPEFGQTDFLRDVIEDSTQVHIGKCDKVDNG